MGKRSGFNEVRPRDLWPTIDPDAICKPFIDAVRGAKYAEPCYGAGDLEELLMETATCNWRSDLQPQIYSTKVRQLDALKLTREHLHDVSLIITNPPYSWNLLQPLLDHLPTLKPTWMLLPADFMHNKRSGPYMKTCSDIIAIGRLYWVEEPGIKPTKGKDNYCWYRFKAGFHHRTEFTGR